ncbi:hypothetical protein Tco_1136095 [Tanacetum coccineum]
MITTPESCLYYTIKIRKHLLPTLVNIERYSQQPVTSKCKSRTQVIRLKTVLGIEIGLSLQEIARNRRNVVVLHEFLNQLNQRISKQALELSCWIELLQEEIHDTLDEYGDVLKNKASVSGAKGYRQEAGMIFLRSHLLVARLEADQIFIAHEQQGVMKQGDITSGSAQISWTSALLAGHPKKKAEKSASPHRSCSTLAFQGTLIFVSTYLQQVERKVLVVFRWKPKYQLAEYITNRLLPRERFATTPPAAWSETDVTGDSEGTTR